jgi:hypothetical protein
VAHTCNPSYLGGRDQEDQGSKPAQSNSLQASISKIPNTHTQRAHGVAQVVEHLCSKCEAELKYEYVYIYTHTHTHTHREKKREGKREWEGKTRLRENEFIFLGKGTHFGV